jgi:hypothetical protein
MYINQLASGGQDPFEAAAALYPDRVHVKDYPTALKAHDWLRENFHNSEWVEGPLYFCFSDPSIAVQFRLLFS